MSFDCPRCGLEADYIPGGEPVHEVCNIREVPSGYFARCGTSTSYDPQSGPIYCGGRATWMADSVGGSGGVVLVCSKHKSSLTRLLPKPKPVEKEPDWYD
jgi:hypothetical protein